MATREVVTLNESTPQLVVPQAGDTYLLPRATQVTGVLTVTDRVTVPGYLVPLYLAAPPEDLLGSGYLSVTCTLSTCQASSGLAGDGANLYLLPAGVQVGQIKTVVRYVDENMVNPSTANRIIIEADGCTIDGEASVILERLADAADAMFPYSIGSSWTGIWTGTLWRTVLLTGNWREIL